MKRADMTAAEAKEQFWYVVAECLRVFHHMNGQSVITAISKFRSKTERLSREAKELFYHSEPFDVACEIAERQLDVQDHLSRYLEIRDTEAANLLRPSEEA
jgi:hypothetical protein